MDAEEKKRVGKDLKQWLIENGISRDMFADKVGLSKSTIDKAVTGMMTEKIYGQLTSRSEFKSKTIYASKLLGGYTKTSWEAYLSKFDMIHPHLSGNGSIVLSTVEISWDETLPGMILRMGLDQIGALWIPHPRSPLIYIQPTNTIGVRLILSTMVGMPRMRGLLMTVHNVLANAYIPVSFPVVLRMRDQEKDKRETYSRIITIGDSEYDDLCSQLSEVLDRNFGMMIRPLQKTSSGTGC